jgi:hypothetical protein
MTISQARHYPSQRLTVTPFQTTLIVLKKSGAGFASSLDADGFVVPPLTFPPFSSLFVCFPSQPNFSSIYAQLFDDSCGFSQP